MPLNFKLQVRPLTNFLPPFLSPLFHNNANIFLGWIFLGIKTQIKLRVFARVSKNSIKHNFFCINIFLHKQTQLFWWMKIWATILLLGFLGEGIWWRMIFFNRKFKFIYATPLTTIQQQKNIPSEQFWSTFLAWILAFKKNFGSGGIFQVRIKTHKNHLSCNQNKPPGFSVKMGFPPRLLLGHPHAKLSVQ